MHIEKISLRNFRCFGDTPVSIPIDAGITAFIGNNGAGKSSALEALKRLFSPTRSDRRIRKADTPLVASLRRQKSDGSLNPNQSFRKTCPMGWCVNRR